MSITQGICDSFMTDLFNGKHDFSLDTFRIALYQATANLSPSLTTAYTPTGESSGTGYAAGGQTAAIASGFPKITGNKLQVDFDDLTFSSVTISTHGALIYNDTAAGNPAVAIIDFGAIFMPSAQDFRVKMPDPTSLVAALEVTIARG